MSQHVAHRHSDEIHELRAENERLNEAELLRATEMVKLEQQIGQRDAEIERLTARVAHLEEQLLRALGERVPGK